MKFKDMPYERIGLDEMKKGFAEGGVNLVKDAHYEEMVPEDIRAAVDEMEAKISAGEIKVYSSSTMSTEEIEALKASVALQ